MVANQGCVSGRRVVITGRRGSEAPIGRFWPKVSPSLSIRGPGYGPGLRAGYGLLESVTTMVTAGELA